MIVLAAAGILAMALLDAPLFAVILAAAMLGRFVVDVDLAVTAIELYRITDTPLLVALPFFTFAGYVMAEAGTSRRLMALTRALFGWMPAGLAIVGFVACAVFTALTGASGVTIVALGALLLPMLRDSGYSDRYSLGLVTTSGSLGLLVFPSVPLTELTARVGAALRRRDAAGPFVLGELQIDHTERRVTVAGRLVALTPIEHGLQRALTLNAGHVTTYESLPRQVWSDRAKGDVHAVRDFVKKLRRKLADDPAQPAGILNVRGQGYRMPAPDEAERGGSAPDGALGGAVDEGHKAGTGPSTPRPAPATGDDLVAGAEVPPERPRLGRRFDDDVHDAFPPMHAAPLPAAPSGMPRENEQRFDSRKENAPRSPFHAA